MGGLTNNLKVGWGGDAGRDEGKGTGTLLPLGGAGSNLISSGLD